MSLIEFPIFAFKNFAGLCDFGLWAVCFCSKIETFCEHVGGKMIGSMITRCVFDTILQFKRERKLALLQNAGPLLWSK